MNQQINEEMWREEYLKLNPEPSAWSRTDIFSEWQAGLKYYLAACKKRQEESNYRCNDMSGVCLNCGAKHPEESSCLKALINYHLESLSSTAREMRSLKDELKSERAAVDRADLKIREYRKKITFLADDKYHNLNRLWELDDISKEIKETQAKRKEIL